MKSLYVTKESTLKRKDNTLVIETPGTTMFFPIHTVQTIHVFGNVQMNKTLLNLLNTHGTLVFYYSRQGSYIGAFIPPFNKQGTLILKQAAAYACLQTRLNIAKSILITATDNIISNVKYYKQYLHAHKDVSLFITHCKTRMENAKDIQTLRALEGMVRQKYYRQFDLILRNPGFVFAKRSYRPPNNNVNALISLLNTLLYRTIESLIHASKMHIAIAYLHTSNTRHASLNLDIAEIFKPIIVDRLVFRLINLAMVKPNHFNGTQLTQEGLKIVLQAYDERIHQVLSINQTKRSYIHFIRKDIYTLQNHLTKNTPLKFFLKRDH